MNRWFLFLLAAAALPLSAHGRCAVYRPFRPRPMVVVEAPCFPTPVRVFHTHPWFRPHRRVVCLR